MKKVFIAAVCYGMLMAGCKENDIPLDFGSVSLDTTYVTSVPASTDAHQVLVEEFTGQGCSNCPQAHATLDAISGINVVGMYYNGGPQTFPPGGSLNDFRTTIATNISSTIYNTVGGIPAAGIDRTFESASGGILQTGYTSWSGYITTQKSVTDSLNLSVQSVYNSTTNIATITAVVTYTQAVSTPQNLSIYIVEDSIFDKQEFPDSVHSNYLFMDVFRDMVTAQPSGDPLTVSTGVYSKEAGRLFQRVYSYKLPVLAAPNPAINPLHCRVIAFVNNTNNADVHIQQSAQCKFAP